MWIETPKKNLEYAGDLINLEFVKTIKLFTFNKSVEIETGRETTHRYFFNSEGEAVKFFSSLKKKLGAEKI